MNLITRQSCANSAAARWRRQYFRTTDQHKIGIQSALDALGDTPNPDDVDRIIGNRTWTTPFRCDECKAEPAGYPVMEIGDEPDCDSHTAWLCLAYLKKAVEMMENPPA